MVVKVLLILSLTLGSSGGMLQLPQMRNLLGKVEITNGRMKVFKKGIVKAEIRFKKGYFDKSRELINLLDVQGIVSGDSEIKFFFKDGTYFLNKDLIDLKGELKILYGEYSLSSSSPVIKLDKNGGVLNGKIVVYRGENLKMTSKKLIYRKHKNSILMEEGVSVFYKPKKNNH